MIKLDASVVHVFVESVYEMLLAGPYAELDRFLRDNGIREKYLGDLKPALVQITVASVKQPFNQDYLVGFLHGTIALHFDDQLYEVRNVANSRLNNSVAADKEKAN